MNTIEYENKIYPEFQTNGNAARFIMPFAKEVLLGKGLDIGCMKAEWSFPGSIPIDLTFDDQWEAMNLPDEKYDYIFSSHCFYTDKLYLQSVYKFQFYLNQTLTLLI